MSNEGYFKLKSKLKLDELEIGHVISESDYSTLTPDGNFVQLEYVEATEKDQPEFLVKPGIWVINHNQAQGMFLIPTSFVKDRILEEFVHTKHITDKIELFFRKINVYYEMGFEVPKRAALLYGPAGCHAKGTKILMHDGSVKNVEYIVVGDQLMGPDSLPKTVKSLLTGNEPMLKVTPTKGDSFVVNYGHIFNVSTRDNSLKEFKGENSGNLPANVIFEGGKTLKKSVMLNRSGVNFPKKELPIPPYILGAWLGDGTSENTNITTMDVEIKNEWENYSVQLGLNFNKIADKGQAATYSITKGNGPGPKKGKNPFLTNLQELELINNKHIPKIYLTSDRNDRLELLAGLIDTSSCKLVKNGFLPFLGPGPLPFVME